MGSSGSNGAGPSKATSEIKPYRSKDPVKPEVCMISQGNSTLNISQYIYIYIYIHCECFHYLFLFLSIYVHDVHVNMTCFWRGNPFETSHAFSSSEHPTSPAFALDSFGPPPKKTRTKRPDLSFVGTPIAPRHLSWRALMLKGFPWPSGRRRPDPSGSTGPP